MTIDRACEILDPEHREHYESIEPVNEACRMAIKALRAQQWISVEDRLPMNNKPVQVYMPKLYRNIQTAFYDRYYGEDDGEWHEQWISNGDVTHWRELPQPPKGDAK